MCFVIIVDFNILIQTRERSENTTRPLKQLLYTFRKNFELPFVK